MNVRLLDQLFQAVVTEENLDALFLAQALDHPQDSRQFLFGKHIHLQIEVRPLLRLACQSVLRHQHEDGKKDRLQRHNERQEVERIRVERLDTGHGARVDKQPQAETDQVKQREGSAAGLAADRIAQTIGGASLMEGLLFQISNGANVFPQHRGVFVHHLSYLKTPAISSVWKSPIQSK